MKKILLTFAFSLLLFTFLKSQNQQVELKIPSGHNDIIFDIEFNKDSTKLLSASADGTAKLWNINTGTEIATLNAHSDEVTAAIFVNDSLAATASADKTIILWNLKTFQPLDTIEAHQDRITCIDATKNSKYLVSGSKDKTLKLWNIETRQQINIYKGHDWSVVSVAFSPDGSKIASGSYDKTIKIWNTIAGDIVHTLQGHTRSVNALKFTNDGKKLVSGDNYNVIKYWNVQNGQLIHSFKSHASAINGVDISDIKKYIYSGSSDKTLQRFEIQPLIKEEDTAGKIQRFNGHTREITDIELNPYQIFIASASQDNTIKYWYTVTQDEIKTIKKRTNDILKAKFSDDGKKIILSTANHKVKIWDFENEKITTFKGHEQLLSDFVFNSKNNILISVSHDRFVKIFDVTTQKELLSLKSHTQNINAIAISKSGEYAVSGGDDNKLIRWNLETKSKDKIFSEKHNAQILNIDISNNQKYIATASSDETAVVWNFEDGQEVQELKHKEEVNAVAFSSDNAHIATASDVITIWKLNEKKPIKTLREHTGKVQSVKFFNNGNYLLSFATDSTVIIWDWKNEKSIKKFNPHKTLISSVDISPNEKFILTTSSDQTIKIWNTENYNLNTTLIPINENGFAAVRQNYYYCSPGTDQFLGYQKNGQAFNAQQLELWLNRPDMIIPYLPYDANKLTKFYAENYQKQLEKQGFSATEIAKEFHAPKIKLHQVHNFKDSTLTENLTVSIEVLDTKYSVKQVIAKINNSQIQKFLPPDNAKKTHFLISPQIKLMDGKNRIDIYAQNVKGAKSTIQTIFIYYKCEK